MPAIVFPNQSGRSGLAPTAPRPYVRSRLPVAGSSLNRGTKQPATPSFTPNSTRQNIAKDAYSITTNGNTLLQSKFTPTDSRRPVYEVTTDVASHKWATTILWRFDPGERKVVEVARIHWSTVGKNMVEMGEVRVPVTEFLTKSKWRLGMSSVAQTFTSEMEEYRWIPQPTLFNVEPCTWQCVIPISRGTTAGSTILSVYRPSSLREASPPSHSDLILKRTQSTSSTSHRFPTSEDSVRSPPSRHGRLDGSRKGGRQPAVLQMYPEVNSKPHLREIIILTLILVVVHKEEWWNIPPSWANVTTPDVVLSRLSETMHDPELNSSTVNNIV